MFEGGQRWVLAKALVWGVNLQSRRGFLSSLRFQRSIPIPPYLGKGVSSGLT